ncbi:hypothetical protein B0T16DRAFT_463217 [Cercophora newfieldiana]|uniref:Velvet domain-containing protein n=1 Tax=Cercophora newfieldiana TaxID=92897 RepID=A0AA39XU99_9PEZI|nr:hypothetical protein B0T16DRAFT_463217 [Cercophora newfieldiana]
MSSSKSHRQGSGSHKTSSGSKSSGSRSSGNKEYSSQSSESGPPGAQVRILVQPPNQIGMGDMVWPSVVAGARLYNMHPDEATYVFAMAVLVTPDEQVTGVHLGGNTAASGTVLPAEQSGRSGGSRSGGSSSSRSGGGSSSSSSGRSGYPSIFCHFAFTDLHVGDVGEYAIRIDVFIYKPSPTDPEEWITEFIAQDTTRSFAVYHERCAIERPTEDESRTLRRLRNSGERIPNTPA